MDSEATRMIVAAKNLTPAAADHLNAIYSDEELTKTPCGGWRPRRSRCACARRCRRRRPAAQAAEFWRVVGEDLLPKPSPRIAPGYMLAGKLAYLEAGTVPTAVFEHPTPAGVLTIEARAEHWGDWGDGSSLSGPSTTPATRGPPAPSRTTGPPSGGTTSV